MHNKISETWFKCANPTALVCPSLTRDQGSTLRLVFPKSFRRQSSNHPRCQNRRAKIIFNLKM